MDIESWQEQGGGRTSSRGYLPTEDARDKHVPKRSDFRGKNKKATASNSGSGSPVKQRS